MNILCHWTYCRDRSEYLKGAFGPYDLFWKSFYCLDSGSCHSHLSLCHPDLALLPRSNLCCLNLASPHMPNLACQAMLCCLQGSPWVQKLGSQGTAISNATMCPLLIFQTRDVSSGPHDMAVQPGSGL